MLIACVYSDFLGVDVDDDDESASTLEAVSSRMARRRLACSS